MTPEDELASCEKTDRAFGALLGRTLQAATFRLAAIAVVMCALFAGISGFVG